MKTSAKNTKRMVKSASGIQRKIKLKNRSWEPLQALRALEQLSQMIAQNLKLLKGLHKPPQL